MAAGETLALERAWRKIMHTMGHTHPRAVTRNRIVVRVIRDRQRRR